MSVTSQLLSSGGGQAMHSDPVQAVQHAASPETSANPGGLDVVIGLGVLLGLYFVTHVLHRRVL